MILIDLAGHLAALAGGFGAGIQAAGAAAADGAASVADSATTFAATLQPEAVERRLRFLSWAYTSVWLILAGYLMLMSVRQRRLERQLRLLRERVNPPTPTLRS